MCRVTCYNIITDQNQRIEWLKNSVDYIYPHRHMASGARTFFDPSWASLLSRHEMTIRMHDISTDWCREERVGCRVQFSVILQRRSCQPIRQKVDIRGRHPASFRCTNETHRLLNLVFLKAVKARSAARSTKITSRALNPFRIFFRTRCIYRVRASYKVFPEQRSNCLFALYLFFHVVKLVFNLF